MFQMGDGVLELQLKDLVLCCGERNQYNLCMAYFSLGSISRRENTYWCWFWRKILEFPVSNPYF